MNRKETIKNLSYALVLLLTAIIVTMLVYRGAIPQRYSFKVGEFSDVDVFSPRDIKDTVGTELRAETARMQAERNPVYMKSKDISDKGVSDVNELFSMVSDIRKAMIDPDGGYNFSYSTGSKMLFEEAVKTFGVELSNDITFFMVSTDDTNYRLLQSQGVSIASLIMTNQVDETKLQAEIDRLSEDQSPQPDARMQSGSGVTNADIVKLILGSLLKPNAVIDWDATEASMKSTYDAVMNDPIMIEKGVRIVSIGQRITQTDFDLLSDLGMIETASLDVRYLLSVFAYSVFVLFALGFYIMILQKDLIRNRRILIAIALSVFITLLSAIYLSDISSLLIPVYFSAVIISIYLGTSPGIVFSLALILLLLPVSRFDSEFIFVSISGCFACCVLSGDRKRKYNSAFLILLAGGVCVLASVFYNLVVSASLTKLAVSALWAVISGVVSVILATGFMPIFELISNSISPIRLIDLSQPGFSLQKRLFMEAPGTYQHSMMVAALAESAAEEIGANALLAKVGAYYHDIGKLENPEYFTENQQHGVNPHDLLSPDESCSIILAHLDNGVRLGRRYRLPIGLIRFIQEHHGTTFQSYFYHKAKEIALSKGEPEPPVSKFRYKGQLPSSKESAIVMLADTCEAAIKSTGTTNLTEAQELFRKLIKGKIDQDQLVNSGLSFTDLENIIRSFLQVYAGVFHERIKYPDEANNR